MSIFIKSKPIYFLLKAWEQQTDNRYVIALSKFGLCSWAFLQFTNRLSQIWPHSYLPFVLTATSLLGKEEAWTFSLIYFECDTPSPVKPETYRYSAIHLTFPLGHLLVHQRRTLDLQQPVWNKFKRRLGIIMKCFNTSFPLWVCSIWTYI